MSYLGSPPASQFFAPGTDTFSGDGTTVAFTLSRNVATVNDILVVVNNVDQQPTAYTVSVSTLTFTAAPSAGTNNIYVRYLSTNLTAIVPQAGSIVPGNFGIDGNLNFSGSARRITGDFSNATAANRVMFQNSTTNGRTNISALPNGTSTTAGVDLYGSSSDLANTSLFRIANTNAEYQLEGTRNGTGSFLPMTFYTGGSERMRVDTAGITKFRGTGSAYDSTPGDGVSDGLYLQVDSSGIAHIDSYAGGGSTALAFGTNSGGGAVVERMRIDSTGGVRIKTITNIYNSAINEALTVDNGTNGNACTFSTNASGGFPVVYMRHQLAGSQNQIVFYSSAGVAGSITSNGLTASYNSASDYRLKENVQPMVGALDKVAQLKPCTYNWKHDGSDGQGFIAHELQEVVPDAVVGEKDAVDADGNPKYQGVDTSFLVATLTAAIQEQQAMIEELKTKVAALEAR